MHNRKPVMHNLGRLRLLSASAALTHIFDDLPVDSPEL